MSFFVEYQSPLPTNMPLLDALRFAALGASTGVLLYLPFLKAAQTAKATKTPYVESVTTLFLKATKQPIRMMYGPFPWSMIREAQWVTKYPTINWVNQKLESYVSNSHFRLLSASALVAGQEWTCYGIGDFLYTSHEMGKVNNWKVSTKEHLVRALSSRRIGAIHYIVTNTIWQFGTMGGISMLQQSLPGRVKRAVPKEILRPISFFFPTLLATIAMVPFNAVKTVVQTSSKDKVLGTIAALSKLDFRGIYRGTWPTIFFATAKITTGLTIATILGEQSSMKTKKMKHDKSEEK